MMKAALYTKDGGFVEEIDMPPFVVPPDVVVWGERIFCLSPRVAGRKRFPAHRPIRYDEAFAWFYVGLRRRGEETPFVPGESAVPPAMVMTSGTVMTGGTPGCAGGQRQGAPTCSHMWYDEKCVACRLFYGDSPVPGPEEVEKWRDENKKK